MALLFDIALGWSVLSVSLLKVCWCRIGEERLLAWKFLLMLHPMMRHACEVCVCHSVCPSVVVLLWTNRMTQTNFTSMPHHRMQHQ